mmetsp:Transcript_23772/g.33268  ORF Transcript_23772/g.33268 Transcript_23772/m.33268 type:complete len:93 (-) Transcript_23772:111-389(-)
MPCAPGSCEPGEDASMPAVWIPNTLQDQGEKTYSVLCEIDTQDQELSAHIGFVQIEIETSGNAILSILLRRISRACAHVCISSTCDAPEYKA